MSISKKNFKHGKLVKILTDHGVFIGKLIWYADEELGDVRDVEFEEEETFIAIKLTVCTAPFKTGELVFFNVDHIVAITFLCECPK